MKGKVRGIMILLGFAALGGLAYLAAYHWQAQQTRQYSRVQAVEDCDLRAGACRRAVAGGWVSLSITPRTIPLMQPLHLSVEIDGLVAHAVQVEIRGLNMDMGLNRTLLQGIQDGRWEGETILPICSQRRMQWEAAVRLDGDGRFEVPFVFDTRRE